MKNTKKFKNLWNLPYDTISALSQLLRHSISLVDDEVLVENLEDFSSLQVAHVERCVCVCVYIYIYLLVSSLLERGLEVWKCKLRWAELVDEDFATEADVRNVAISGCLPLQGPRV